MSAVLIPSPVYTEPKGESVAERIWRQSHEDMAYFHLSGAQRYTRRINFAIPGPALYQDEAKREQKRADAKMHIEALLSRKVKIPALLLELARAEGIL